MLGGVVAALCAAAAGIVYFKNPLKHQPSPETRNESAARPASKEAPGGPSPFRAFGGKTDLPTSAAPKEGDADPDAAKGLEIVNALLDRVGVGNRPPNPYEELPVVKSDTINKNLCDPDDNAKEAPDSTPKPGPSGIPMVKGLLVVHAWGRKSGDSESMNSVSKITDKYVEVSDTGTFFPNPDALKGTPSAVIRDVCTEDLQRAPGLSTGFSTDGPRTLPGTTTIHVSDVVLNDLKTKGRVDFRYVEYYRMQDLPEGEGYLHWERGVLARVEPGDVSLPVIVNGTPTTLPAIHAAGTMLVESKKAQELSKSPADQPLATELYVLDDPADPLVLLFKQSINNFRIQVTEIRFPAPQPETTIERDLSKKKKAVIYGIYFDYNSAEIKKESEPVLEEIARVMKKNPDWKLSVAGHTDNIGGDAFNLRLSERRSAAVKRALVERFQIRPDRLATEGFGMRQPVATNDTLEGRARNRRVELTRE